MRRCLLTIPLLACLFVPPASAQDLKAIEKHLKTDYEGKIVTIRGFYGGDRLRFDSEGNLLKGGPPGPWTLNGQIEIIDIDVSSSEVTVLANRLYALYDQEEKHFQQMRSGRRVEVEIVFRDEPNPAAVAAGFANVFISEIQQLAEAAPPYWKYFLLGRKGGSTKKEQPSSQGHDEGSEAEPGATPTVREAKPGDVTPARLVTRVHPKYPDIARRAKIEGTIELEAVINERGRVQDIRIIKPRGMGLDDAAVEAVSQWEYEPTRLLGEPVEVVTYISVVFQLR